MPLRVISLSSSLLNAVTVTLPYNPALPPSLVSLSLCSLSPSGLSLPLTLLPSGAHLSAVKLYKS